MQYTWAVGDAAEQGNLSWRQRHDADAAFSPAAISNITHVTDDEYGPAIIFEPRQCAMPGCRGFEHPATVLDFYIHMEEDAHARWLLVPLPTPALSAARKASLTHILSIDTIQKLTRKTLTLP